MKGLFWSLVATLAGVAMLGVGIAGVAGAFGGDDSSGSKSSGDVSNFAACPTNDSRFGRFKTIDLAGDAGSASLFVSCQDGSIEVSMVAVGLDAQKDRTVALWLYNNHDDAELIGASQQAAGDDTVVTDGSLPDDSENYKKVVVTEEPAAPLLDDPKAPTKVILQVKP